ncbi:MAG: DUF4339 domain-containing protein [Pedosphaera sp.]|nr:DUF4339 domain-containing protein [Pedosphaera sp.]
MYKIIGADGKEYGPHAADVLKKWLAEGRINAQTKVLPEGATEWKALGEIPELAAAIPAEVAAAPSSFSTGVTPATGQTNGPGIALIVAGSLYLLLACFRFLSTIVGFGFAAAQRSGNPELDRIFAIAGPINLAIGVLTLVLGLVVLFGGIKMRQLKSYGLCMTAAIIAMIPCTFPCCFIGLPIGIWAIVILSKAEVKSQFH